MDSTTMTLGRKIQTLREEQNMTQKELAAILSVTTGTIAEWEADEDVPGLAALSKLSKALSVPADVLLDAAVEIDEKVPATPSPTVQAPAKPTPAPKQKHKKLPWIIGIVAVCALIAVVAVLLLGGGGSPTTPKETTAAPTVPLAFSEDTAAIEAADDSVVTIFCYDYDGNLAATGSGFVAFDGKTIVTNYHVMSSAYTCKISTNQDITYEASRILCYSESHDLAILQTAEDTGLQPLPLGDSLSIKKGEPVVAIGSPLGIKNTVSTGVLSGRVMEDNMDVLQFTAPTSSGSSGGALFDNSGNVIGVTYASYIDGQNLNLAVPIEQVEQLMDNFSGIGKKISAIYLEEHPYITKLAQFNGVPEITIDELLNNPEKYNDRTIKVYGYLSSVYSYWYDPEWGKYSETFTPYEKQMLYISSKANVTGNGAADYATCESALKGYIRHRILDVIIDERVYLSESAQPGDRICWIGEISYWETSNGYIVFSTYPDLCFSID